MRFNFLFLFLFVVHFLAGCVTKPVKTDGRYQKAEWETKALIKNLRENKNQSLSIDIYAIKDSKLRMEVSALMGFQVASMVMTPQEISYIIYSQKYFFHGRNSERAFSHFLTLPLHPMNLANIAFDEPIKGPGWSCSSNTLGLPSHCENIQKDIRVTWSDRTQGQKKVLIAAPQFEMQWQFSVPKTEVQFKEDLFNLKQPSGFKAIQIN
ncbi:MAG: hypothetical protein ACXWQX_12405 [Bdellovibrio sp.]